MFIVVISEKWFLKIWKSWMMRPNNLLTVIGVGWFFSKVVAPLLLGTGTRKPESWIKEDPKSPVTPIRQLDRWWANCYVLLVWVIRGSLCCCRDGHSRWTNAKMGRSWPGEVITIQYAVKHGRGHCVSVQPHCTSSRIKYLCNTFAITIGNHIICSSSRNVHVKGPKPMVQHRVRRISFI